MNYRHGLNYDFYRYSLYIIKVNRYMIHAKKPLFEISKTLTLLLSEKYALINEYTF